LQHLRWQTFWRSDELEQLLVRPPFQHFSSLDPRLLKLLAMSGSTHPLDQQQYVDIKSYLPDDILFKVDRMSMAVSLETRGPFLDYTLVEFAASLPPALRLRGITGKYLLKRAMQDMLPQQILHRKKLGFNIPYKNWLRHELRDLLQDALAPMRLKRQGIFHASYVQSLVHEHLSGRQDHAHKLWQLLMFQLWAERYLSASPSSLLRKEIDSRAVNL
jgi:asparagine synthase (glutamine-hydrolysing)